MRAYSLLKVGRGKPPMYATVIALSALAYSPKHLGANPRSIYSGVGFIDELELFWGSIDGTSHVLKYIRAITRPFLSIYIHPELDRLDKLTNPCEC